jgi:hypothetical protein
MLYLPRFPSSSKVPTVYLTGYRDVCLNVRIDSDASRLLGVEYHVCEVQLLLLSMAQIKAEREAERGGERGRGGGVLARG